MRENLLKFFKNNGVLTPLLSETQDRMGKEETIQSIPSFPDKKSLKAPPTQSSMPAKKQSLSPDLSNIQSLKDLKESLKNFDSCDLKETALNTVFCDGQEDAPVMLVGEAPGAEEDKLEKPFVGQSGQLIDLMFSKIGLSRDKNIYISNIIPWRPPANRTPSTSEIALCLPFIKKHIAIKKPKALVLLGGVAAKSLLDTKDGILKLRGKWHHIDFEGVTIPTLPMYHPAYLLRSPGQKAHVWYDLLFLKKYLKNEGIPY